MEIEIIEGRKVDVKFLRAECGVRYWEDAVVNGVEDSDGTLVPCRAGEYWSPVIDIESGTIEGWPTGTTAEIHYKVCDDGRYTLLDAARTEIATIEDYVPKIMCPGGSGFGDYVIMSIDGAGKIGDWRPQLDAWQHDRETA